MTDDRETWQIRMTGRSIERRTAFGEVLTFGDEGRVLEAVGRGYVRRGEAVRLDGCQATTDGGTPCANDATDGKYCGVHSDAE